MHKRNEFRVMRFGKEFSLVLVGDNIHVMEVEKSNSRHPHHYYLYLHVDSTICLVTKGALPMSPAICWTYVCSIFSLLAWFAAMYVLLGTAFLVNGQPYDARTLLFVGQTYTAMFEFEAYTPRNYVVCFSGISVAYRIILSAPALNCEKSQPSIIYP